MELNEQKRKSMFLVVLMGCIVTSLLSTAMTTALPLIMESFRVTASVGQWLTSAFSLVVAIVVLASAWLIKRFPTRKLYTSALALFSAGLLMDALAASFPMLLLGRILQACGNGVLMSLSQVVLLTIYPPDRRGAAMGMYGLAVGAAPVVSPTLAGLVADLFGWRMIFIFAFVFSVISLILAGILVKNVTENEIQKFDTLSLLFCGLGSTGILLGLGNTGTYGIISVHTFIPLLVGILFSIIFCIRQLRLKTPFLEIRIFHNFEFRTAVIGSMLLYAVMISASTLMPILIQSVYGYTATISGLVMIPGSVAMAVISPFTGKIYDRFGIRKLFIVGSTALFLSSLCMSLLTASTSLIYLALVNLVRSVAIGCLMMPLVTWGMSRLSPEHTADGTSMITSLRTIAGSIGSAVFVSVMTLASQISADIRGMCAAFLCLTALAAAEIIIALFCTKKR